MRDYGHEAADAAVEEWRAEVAEEYEKADEYAREELDGYLSDFSDEDDEKRSLVAAGALTAAAYAAWRRSRMLSGRRYARMLDKVASRYATANARAVAALSRRLPSVHAENASFAAYKLCAKLGRDLPLADGELAAAKFGEEMLPKPSHNRPKDEAWNRKLVASQLRQGIMLGESIPTMAKRVENVTGSNAAAATRTARTYATAAENAARVASYEAAKSLGIDLKQEWLATMDGRTRHSHRQLNGEQVEVGARFSNGCRFPGDPDAPYAETMNCRCTLVAAVEGIDTSDAKRWSRLPKGTTYEQWKARKQRD